MIPESMLYCYYFVENSFPQFFWLIKVLYRNCEF